MARKKVTLVWIADESARRTSLRKRRLGLLKKVSELTTLCGTKACVIIYSPEESEPMLWPSHAEVHRLLEEYWKMPELERLRKKMNQETYLKERLAKAEEQLMKLQRRNQEVEMGNLMHRIEQERGIVELSYVELHGLAWLVEEKMKEIRRRIEYFHKAPFASPDHHHGEPMARVNGNGSEPLLMDQWFVDIMMNNNTEHTFADIAASQDMGQSFGGTSSVALAPGTEVSSYGDFRGPTTHFGQLPLDLSSHGSGATDMGSSFSVSEQGPAFCPLDSGDIGMQFDGKSWPNNFSP